MDLVVDSRIEGFYGIELSMAVPRTTRLQLEMTDGGVESDFLLLDRDGLSVAADLDTLDPGATRVLQAEINGGGPRYDFFTANGTVFLRKIQRTTN